MYNGLFKSLTALSSYWLGFIAADGSVGKYGRSYRFHFGLKISDADTVKQLATDMGFSTDRVKVKKDARLQISNKEIFDDLNNVGIIPQKTRKLDHKVIPHQYFWQFLLGVIDGDGSVGLYNFKGYRFKKPVVSIYGHKNFLDALAERINSEFDGAASVIANRAEIGVYQLRIINRDLIYKIYYKMYGESQRWLPRKREKFDEIVNYINNTDFTVARGKLRKEIIQKKTIICKKCYREVRKRIDYQSEYCTKRCATTGFKRLDKHRNLQCKRIGQHNFYWVLCIYCKNPYWKRSDHKGYCSLRCSRKHYFERNKNGRVESSEG